MFYTNSISLLVKVALLFQVDEVDCGSDCFDYILLLIINIAINVLTSIKARFGLRVEITPAVLLRHQESQHQVPRLEYFCSGHGAELPGKAQAPAAKGGR